MDEMEEKVESAQWLRLRQFKILLILVTHVSQIHITLQTHKMR